jgi:hypothetical protein
MEGKYTFFFMLNSLLLWPWCLGQFALRFINGSELFLQTQKVRKSIVIFYAIAYLSYHFTVTQKRWKEKIRLLFYVKLVIIMIMMSGLICFEVYKWVRYFFNESKSVSQLMHFWCNCLLGLSFHCNSRQGRKRSLFMY